MKPRTSDPLPWGEARKLARWWEGHRGPGGKQWSAEVRKDSRGLFRVRVW